MNQWFGLLDKTVVVAGGAGRLGTRVVSALLAANAKVVRADTDHALQAAQTHRNDVHDIPFDSASEESVNSLISQAYSVVGPVGGLVVTIYPKNANYGVRLPSVARQDFNENVCGHLGGYFTLNQKFAAAMVESGGGSIVNISSVYGSIAPRFDLYDGTEMTMPVEYAAAKAAVDNLSRYFASYFRGTNLRVNSVSPGGLRADQPETFVTRYNGLCLNKGMLDPEDVTGAILFLLSSSAVYINGQNIVVDDGFSL